MTPVATPAASLPSSFIKMEDRKRSAGHGADDLAPPTKRQAVNGGSKSSADNDMPWKDDLEVSLTAPLARAVRSGYPSVEDPSGVS